MALILTSPTREPRAHTMLPTAIGESVINLSVWIRDVGVTAQCLTSNALLPFVSVIFGASRLWRGEATSSSAPGLLDPA